MTYYKSIDVAKGIGILLVIIGHSINQLTPLASSTIIITIRDLIYSFHIPLFFFLSGVLLNYSTNIQEFIRKKVKRLVIPYIFSYILISIILFISYILIKTPPSFSGFQYLFGLLFGTLLEFMAQTNTNILNPLWFLTTLFCALLISYFLLTILSKDLLSGFILLIVTIGVGFSFSLKHIYLPWGFEIAMVAQIFMFPGFYFKKLGYEEIKKLNGWSGLLLVFGFLLAFYINGKPEMSVGAYNNQFLFWIGAMCAIIGTCYLSYHLVSYPFIEKTLSFFGKNSLIIFCFHMLSNVVIQFIAVFIPLITEIYYSNVFFEIACMLILSIIFIFIIHKISYIKNIFSSV